MDPTAFVIPCLLAGVALYALTRRVDVYAALTQGAGEGLTVVAKILPALVGLLTAVYMLRASGARDALAAALAPVLGLLGIPPETAALINETRKNGGRVICVGTTSCRTLESWAQEDGHMEPSAGWTNIYIYPGYRFKVMDALITNFHLPQSTLIMLVSALAGREHVLHAYEEAVKERYRFFSFGDAMFIVDRES